VGVGSVFAQQPATDLQLTLIEQPADLEGHRHLLSAEANLMGGEPVDFLLGDDPGGHGFQEHLSHEYGGLMRAGGMVMLPCRHALPVHAP